MSSILEKARRKAEQLLGNRERIDDLANQAQEKVRSIRIGDENIASLMDLINTFLRMLRAHFRGLYHDIPWRTLSLIVAGLVYFINPFDVVPDFIPVAGLLDDLTLLLLILKSIRKDVDLFKDWELQTLHSES